MANFLEFRTLRPGQFLKISGKSRPGQPFLAIEIVVFDEVLSDMLESTLEGYDLDNGTLTVLGQRVRLQPDVSVLDASGENTSKPELANGNMVKLKGAFDPGKGFLADTLQTLETLSFNIENMRGVIGEVDSERGTLLLNGVRVASDDRTLIYAAA